MNKIGPAVTTEHVICSSELLLKNIHPLGICFIQPSDQEFIFLLKSCRTVLLKQVNLKHN